MKNMMKVFALVLALGATVQAIQAYAQEQQTTVSIEEAEERLIHLIELRRDLDSDNTQTDASIREVFTQEALRYIQIIGGQEALRRNLQQNNRLMSPERGDPGV